MKPIRLTREQELTVIQDAGGVLHVEARTEGDLYFAMGYAQALDRSLQLLVTRLVAQGRVSECLAASDESLKIDAFFRRMHWRHETVDQRALLRPETLRHLEAFCDGINTRLSQKVPWELKLLGYRKPEPYTVEDIILFQRLLGYLSQEESQLQWEGLLIQLVQADAPDALLADLFGREHLEHLDRALVRALPRKQENAVPPEAWAFVAAPLASNNWAVGPSRSASGAAMLCSDPHLETNRLPAIWQEMVLRLRNDETNRFAAGALMPGLPGILIGRNNDVAWSATYPFMDCADSWIEECRDGRYRYGEEWRSFSERREVIRRKGKEPVTLTFYDNHHGVLDGNPHEAGMYLCTGWTPVMNTGAASIEAARNLLPAASVEEVLDALGRIETAWNFVAADCRGNIGYQMSGLMPRRRAGATGLVPLPGWEPENDWQGHVPPEELPRTFNPTSGYVITANNNLNDLGVAKPINQAMGPYRADRVRELLEGKEAHHPDDMMRYQHDVHSLQAERFLAILGPLLPDSPAGETLRAWDCRYDTASTAPTLFEALYRALLLEVLGRRGLGRKAVEHILDETTLPIAYFGAFDRILLEGGPHWFGGETREAVFARVAAATLTDLAARPWGEVNQLYMAHLLFGKRLPKCFGYDRGPFPLKGGRATPHQAQIFSVGGRNSSFVATLRLVADLSESILRTSLAGGPSDRRLSRLYANEIQDWLEGNYKALRLD